MKVHRGGKYLQSNLPGRRHSAYAGSAASSVICSVNTSFLFMLLFLLSVFYQQAGKSGNSL